MSDITKAKILIVDDEPENIRVLAILLRGKYTATAVTNGFKALEQAVSETARPDLILLDVMMPEMDGYEVCRRLKRDERTRGIPVIFITAMGEVENETLGFQVGATDYIAKPFHPAVVEARVRTHLELKKHRDHLEELAETRARQLIHAERLAMLGTLLAGIAHEINNPLSSILSGVQNTFRRLSPEVEANIAVSKACGAELSVIREYLKQRNIFRYFEAIEENTCRCIKIVSDMLNFSRSSDYQQSIQADIHHLLDDMVHLAISDYDLKKKYNFGHITVIRRYDKGLPQIPCVPNELQQVIFNLLKNAAQAMAEVKQENYKPVIELKTSRSGNEAVIEVADNAGGMAEEIRRRIFDPFFTTKGAGAGTGLGLSISYFIITEIHKGKMSVESGLGKGSRFTICLPL